MGAQREVWQVPQVRSANLGSPSTGSSNQGGGGGEPGVGYQNEETCAVLWHGGMKGNKHPVPPTQRRKRGLGGAGGDTPHNRLSIAPLTGADEGCVVGVEGGTRRGVKGGNTCIGAVVYAAWGPVRGQHVQLAVCQRLSNM